MRTIAVRCSVGRSLTDSSARRALKPPGYVPDWHVGIRVAESGKLVGFISGVPMDLRIRNACVCLPGRRPTSGALTPREPPLRRTKRVNEINFLCVHKKLRSKRLAPLLIQEVTRRTHLKGLFQAIYTSGTFLPTPFSRCQYYHRNLNPAKLVKLGFSAVARNSTVARMVNHYRVPAETSIPGLRELEKRDLKQASRLLRAYSARFDVAPMLSNKDVEHALWDGRGKEVNGKREGQVTWSYVVEVRALPSSPRLHLPRHLAKPRPTHLLTGPRDAPHHRRLQLLPPPLDGDPSLASRTRRGRVPLLLRDERRAVVR